MLSYSNVPFIGFLKLGNIKARVVHGSALTQLINFTLESANVILIISEFGVSCCSFLQWHYGILEFFNCSIFFPNFALEVFSNNLGFNNFPTENSMGLASEHWFWLSLSGLSVFNETLNLSQLLSLLFGIRSENRLESVKMLLAVLVGFGLLIQQIKHVVILKFRSLYLNVGSFNDLSQLESLL